MRKETIEHRDPRHIRLGLQTMKVLETKLLQVQSRRCYQQAAVMSDLKNHPVMSSLRQNLRTYNPVGIFLWTTGLSQEQSLIHILLIHLYPLNLLATR